MAAEAVKFVGRQQELALLDERLQRSLAGNGNIIFLAAEPGAGKTTLTSKFLADISARHPEILVIRAACSEQYGAGEPYQPFIEAFRHLTREREGRKGRSFRDLAKQIAPYWVAAIPVAGNAIAAALATAGELKQQFQGGAGGPAAPSEEALFFQYTELFFAAAAEAPVVLFLDDLHWADRATVSLLTHLGRRVGDQRILILGTYRPTEVDTGKHPMRDARQELQRYKVAEEVPLKPLASEALKDLVLLQTGATPSAQLFDWLDKRAGTNALFFEELLNWLVSHGFTRENLGELQLLRMPQEIEIPRSAESTIEKRLDRLDEETRRILEYASVQGNEFDSVGLSRLLEMDELELEEAIEPMVRTHRLVQLIDTRDLPNGDLASIYRFGHSLIQDVLHNGLQGKRRILLHRKMAQILEEIFGSDAASVAGRLALHFEEGRQKDKAYGYALTAAERASRVYARWDALEQIQRALRNAGGEEQESEAWQRLGEEYVAISQYAEAQQAFDEALRRLQPEAAPRRWLRLRQHRLTLDSAQGLMPVQDMLPEMQKLRLEAQRVGDVAEECQIVWRMIDLPGTQESLDVQLAREALVLAEQSGDPWLVARGHEVLGLALTFSPDPSGARDEFGKAVQRYIELGDRSREAGCLGNLSVARVFLGDYENAALEFEATIAIFDEIVDPLRSSVARGNLGAVLQILGDFERAEQRLLEAIQIVERLNVPVRLLSPLMNLAEVSEHRGAFDEAEKYWQRMLEKARETGYTAEQIIAHCGLGTVRLRLGDMDRALASERAARALMNVEPEELGECGEYYQLFAARLANAAGEREGAAALQERIEAFPSGRDRYLAASARLERAEVLLTVDEAKALQLAESALEALRLLSARPKIERAEALIEAIRRSKKWAIAS
jgi:tetratricopeptide (TPR) repeat protein